MPRKWSLHDPLDETLLRKITEVEESRTARQYIGRQFSPSLDSNRYRNGPRDGFNDEQNNFDNHFNSNDRKDPVNFDEKKNKVNFSEQKEKLDFEDAKDETLVNSETQEPSENMSNLRRSYLGQNNSSPLEQPDQNRFNNQQNMSSSVQNKFNQQGINSHKRDKLTTNLSTFLFGFEKYQKVLQKTTPGSTESTSLVSDGPMQLSLGFLFHSTPEENITMTASPKHNNTYDQNEKSTTNGREITVTNNDRPTEGKTDQNSTIKGRNKRLSSENLGRFPREISRKSEKEVKGESFVPIRTLGKTSVDSAITPGNEVSYLLAIVYGAMLVCDLSTLVVYFGSLYKDEGMI